ncbi:MAG: hypothetical protein M8866_07415 [marine benthic group bacterium]|nr:hypothetical protein [Candidatus Benthicola marisminoris]
MTVHRRTFLFLIACAIAWLPASAQAQGIRGDVRLNWGWLQLQPFALDSVLESDVGGSGLQRQLESGTVVTCIDGDFCRWYENNGQRQDIMPFTQDLRFAGWTGVQGLSFHGQMRTRLGSDDLWPRTAQKFDLLTGYLSYSRAAFQVKAGRMYRASGLGYYNFDGASIVYRGLKWLWLDAYGGWSLARGVNAPRNGSLYQDADLLATDQRSYLFGGEIGFRGGKVFSGSATYQRELRTDRLGLYSERAAVDLRALVGGWAFDVAGAYDFAYDNINDARLRITTPQLLGIRFAAQARHYTPFFDYWTIWSAFSPVGFDEARLSGTWTSRQLPLLVELGGAYREYEDTNAGPATTTIKKDGWRGFGRIYWNPDRWYVDARYRAEDGFGGSRYGGDLIFGRFLGPSGTTYLALRGTATETLYEFREGERYVTGGAVEGAYDIPKANLTLDASLGFYRIEDKNRPLADTWTEGRASVGLRWRFNSGGTR